MPWRRSSKEPKRSASSEPLLNLICIQASRWFTRGWTLQELLAPRNLVFFNKDWVEIGHKTLLETKIHLATGIEPQLIRTPHIACVAQKMSWASKRRTTRHEDRSYCLMGLFDVQMPLLYGEGTCCAYVPKILESFLCHSLISSERLRLHFL